MSRFGLKSWSLIWTATVDLRRGHSTELAWATPDSGLVFVQLLSRVFCRRSPVTQDLEAARPFAFQVLLIALYLSQSVVAGVILKSNGQVRKSGVRHTSLDMKRSYV